MSASVTVRRLAALIAALAVMLMFAAPVLATDLNPDHVGTTFDDPESQGTDEGCTADLTEIGIELAEGEVLWHFVLTGTEASTGTLTVDFLNAGDAVVATFWKDTGDTLHWYVITDSPETLEGASTDVSGTNLNLSHICQGPPDTEIPEAPIALILPGIALAMFGVYFVLNRRRSAALG
jgi:hypothetical protein